MIQINLLPEELKVKTKKTAAKSLDQLFLLFPAVIAVFLAMHLVLAGVQLSRASRIRVFSRRLAALEPQRKQLESQRIADADPAKRAINDFLVKNIKWSFKLNRISQHLPAGVWFTEVVFNKKELILRGTVVSLEENEMGAISAFMSSLRNDTEFMQGLGSIDLGPLGTRSVGSYTVTDFILTIPVLST